MAEFHVATPEDIRSGKVTDVYFQRTKRILEAKGMDRRVKAEFVAKGLPEGYSWGVLAGVGDALDLLEGLDVKVRAMPEGTVFLPDQPVMEIEGRYLEFGIYETAVLGLLCHASGIATKAARCKKAAGSKLVVSFGARRAHPALAPFVERYAYIGGCDGVAVVKSAEDLGIPPTGTIPHALVLIMGDVVEAMRAFDDVVEPEVRRVALVDTFQDEKFEALRAAEALGEKLFAVRLDTPSSRRGDFLKILREVRWELDLRGYEHVKIFVSGGIDEHKILRLNPLVDAYGVGTAISNAPVLDFSMDIVEIEGKPVAKRGKPSGSKQVWRCPSCHRTLVVPCGRSYVPACSCGEDYEPLLRTMLLDGRRTEPPASARELRERVLEELKFVKLEEEP
ncbi:MAG: nicotinate phosphoribosyltransferase [Candidatus Latescibacterota bacterium]|nr:MAG: nicotinate phosphoribosyltransferase [Candidatus Latescibacterota bacterium]